MSETGGVSFRRRLKRAATPRLAQNLSGSSKPLLTIVFGLSESRRPGQFELALLPDTDTPQRVVLDHTYSWDPYSHSLTVDFQCRGRVARPTHPDRLFRGAAILRGQLNAAEVRRAPTLPQHVLTVIFSYALWDCADWRKRMVQYGAVCKSWSIIYDLFFGRVCERDCDTIDIGVLERSLYHNPNRGQFLRTVSTNKLNMWSGDMALNQKRMKALAFILQTASLVERIFLDNLRVPLSDEVIQILSKMTQVRFAAFSSPVANSVERRSLSLRVLNSLANWTKLERLHIMHWDTLGARLCWFALAPAICLEFVNLQNIDGLSNAGLTYFLTAISATLKSLKILQCPVHRNDSEERAFDAALPNMEILQHADVAGDIASTVALTRTTVQIPSQFRWQPAMSITIREYSPDRDLLLALEKTTWQCIDLYVRPGAMDHDFVRQAAELGARKSVRLGVHTILD
ncbi:hypothetical protein H0H92_006635 [Tricholoma furcatifolium]|nr:hypothetical protein H0H92_006635 [Tricholoma furcatifolium]